MIPTHYRRYWNAAIQEKNFHYQKILANMLIVNIGKQISNCKFSKKKKLYVLKRGG
jgi:hypothetical protein